MMRCNRCGFLAPSGDHAGAALMTAHLSEHERPSPLGQPTELTMVSVAEASDEALVGELVKRGVLDPGEVVLEWGWTGAPGHYYKTDWIPLPPGYQLPSSDDVFGILRDGAVGETP